MQSFLDVSLIAVFGTAVLLLLFILISYLICSHRVSSLEKENAKLKEHIDATLKALSEQSIKHTQDLASLERKVKAANQSVQYLTDTQQDIFNRQKVLNTSFDDLQLKVEQQKKQFENNSVENQPIILAKRLLAEGMSVVEVAKKTSMPTYEVEMLAKVNNFSRKSASLKLESSALDKNIDEPVKVVPSKEESPVIANARASLASHQVASMKARDAYGIPSKSNLRRPR
jgi:chromosome segregation ATPase